MRGLVVRQSKAIALVAIGALAGGLAIGLRSAGAFGWLEGPTLAARFAVRGEQRPPADVVVVALDVDSLRRIRRYPVPRKVDVEIIDRLRAAGARVIAFDFTLEQPTDDRAADLALARALRRTSSAVVSVTIIGPGGFTQPLVGRVAFGSGVSAGNTYLPTDGDGAVRRFPRWYLGVPTFAVVAAALQSPRTEVAPAPAGALIDFAGPAGTIPTLSFADVRAGRFDPRAVSRRIVVVGPSAPVLGDLHPTAVGGAPMSGPEIQGNAIATALAGYPLRAASGETTAWLLLALGVVAGLLLAGRAVRAPIGTPTVVAAGAVLLGAWSVGAQLAFDAGTVVDYSAGVFAIFAAGAGAGGVVALERRELRELFAAYSPDVVRRVLAQNASDPAALMRSEIITGYRIEDVLEEGGMGVVYRATDLRLDRAVALKLIKPRYALDPRFRARFEREARAAALVGHPNIVPILEAGEDNGLLYIAMLLVDGIDLARTVDVFGPLDHELLVTITRQVASALDAAHAKGLLHRDVKPANILVTGEPCHAYLTDFGIAKHVGADDDITRTEGWVGTLDYLAPEIVAGEQASPRSDVYSLAGVLFYCATGRVPFDLPNETAKLRAHADAPRPSASKAAPGVPARLDAVIARGMAAEPAQRYATAGELVEDAARALAVAGSGARRDAPAGRGRSASEPTL